MTDSVSATEADVLQALRTVQIPGVGGDVVSHELVRNVKICAGAVAFDIQLPPPAASLRQPLEQAARAAVMGVPGVTAVSVRFPPAAPAQPPAAQGLLPDVRHVIAVGSGKGGVGKSTVAVNLAAALAREGARVGLLDADVYGPSIPTMMGAHHPPLSEAGQMIPLESHGVKLMSLGFFIQDATEGVIWRGPMVGGAVRQMLADVRWGALDYLLVDLPPGTGDAQLTLAQTVPLTGAVVVMTSQDVAVNIASKAVGMFRKLNVPILGVVGNMDSFVCPHCDTETVIFARGGSEAAAGRLGVPFLGSIPLDPSIVEHGDAGTPTVVAAPDSTQAEAFRRVARAVLAQVEKEEPAAHDTLGGLRTRLRKEAS
jgi:ATP-binding protein involved in chromosome partitioning